MSVGSSDKPSRIQQAAKLVIKRELASYDSLSRTSRLVYERAVVRAIDDKALSPSYTCGHGVLLFEPCVKCERSVEECAVYRRAAEARIKELLSLLEGKA